VEPTKENHIQRFVALVNQLKDYNDSHGPSARWSAMAQYLGAMPQSPTPACTADGIFLTFSRTLQAIGLEFVQNRGASDVEPPHQGDDTNQPIDLGFVTDRLSFAVCDSQNLVRFFTSIGLREVAIPDVRDALEHLVGDLNEEFVDLYVQACDDPAKASWRNLLKPLGHIQKELERLVFPEAASMTERYLNHAAHGNLKEYLLAERHKMLTDTGDFNARCWHLDTTVDDYSDRWDTAVQTLRQISANASAAGIFQQAHSFLTESANLAQQEIRKLIEQAEPETHWSDCGQQKLEKLSEVLRELGVMESARED